MKLSSAYNNKFFYIQDKLKKKFFEDYEIDDKSVEWEINGVQYEYNCNNRGLKKWLGAYMCSISVINNATKIRTREKVIIAKGEPQKDAVWKFCLEYINQVLAQGRCRYY